MVAMRWLRVALLLLVTANAARADEVDHLLKSGRRIRLTGQTLTGVGCVAALAATILGPFAFMSTMTAPGDRPPEAPPPSQVAPLFGAAIGLGVSATALIAVGIALHAEGDARLDHVRVLVGVGPVRLVLAPQRFE
jgi:hypothetical protein